MELKTLIAVLGLFFYLPIWFYLLHEILEIVNATELMWFLFYTYVPISIVVSAMLKIEDLE
jgi:hypothetical protein